MTDKNEGVSVSEWNDDWEPGGEATNEGEGDKEKKGKEKKGKEKKGKGGGRKKPNETRFVDESNASVTTFYDQYGRKVYTKPPNIDPKE
jgi:heme-degrading monooxygenase HmoA